MNDTQALVADLAEHILARLPPGCYTYQLRAEDLVVHWSGPEGTTRHSITETWHHVPIRHYHTTADLAAAIIAAWRTAHLDR